MADEKKQAKTEQKAQRSEASSASKAKLSAETKQPEESFDPYQIIKYPLSTEKSIRQIEFDNKLVFAVHPRATKSDVKKAVEKMFNVKVAGVNIQNSFTGVKKAYVKLGPESMASDVSADLGLI